MKRKNIFLALIIPGPKYLRKNMDVYMQLLKEELEQTWDEGFKTYDATSKKALKMHVWYQYSMHNMQAYALFSGFCVHGRFPCPTCKADLQFYWPKEVASIPASTCIDSFFL